MTVTDKEIEAAFFTYLNAGFSECAVHYPGMEFSTADKAEWIQPRIFAVTRKPARRGQGFSTYLVNVNVFVKHGVNAYRILEIVDALYSLFDQKDVLVPYPAVLSGLLRWFNFEGSCEDRMGIGDGTPTDISYVTSQPDFGKAASFSGTSTSKVTVADAADIRTLPAFTLSAHVFAKTAGQNGEGRILSKDVTGGNNISFWVSALGGGYLRLNGLVNCATTDAFALSELLVPASQWAHVAMTWDNATKWVSLFVNGAEAAYNNRIQGEGDQVSDAGADSYLGNRNPMAIGGAAGFDGHVDDVRLYNRVLSAAELRAIGGGLGFQFTEMEHRRIPSGEESLDQVNIECRFYVS